MTGAEYLLAMALRYAPHKLPVFPIRASDGRILTWWGTRSSYDEATIRYWVKLYAPDLMWGIAVPPSKIVVDLDVKNGHNGFASFERLAGCHPDTHDTWQATTPSGGRHIWFDTDGHSYFRNTESEIADGIDTKTFRLPRPGDPTDKGGAGMVVVPPAAGRRWLKDGRSGRLMRAPQWLKARFAPRMAMPSAARATTDAHTVLGRQALNHLCDKIRNAPVGKRDKARNNGAYTVGGLVGGGELAACRTEVWNFAAGLFFGCARSFFHLNGR
jgi:hypothetical protein